MTGRAVVESGKRMITALDRLGYLARQSARVGWYIGHYVAAAQFREKSAAGESAPAAQGPLPSRDEILSDLMDVFRRDLENAADGLYPLPRDHDASPLEALARSRRFFADLPEAARRRRDGSSREVADIDRTASLPDYFLQNFHYQTGGYLTRESAELYDLQVEVLFSGCANAMRRRCLAPMARFLEGRDQRRMRFLDVACGTGRFLRFVKEAFPRLAVCACDLSVAYIEEALDHVRPYEVAVDCANAEQLPYASASMDIVTSQYLFHEVPPGVRRTIAAEFARVLKPGGSLVFMDSLQLGDRANYDGLLRGFPRLFHEPYYESYLKEDLEGLLGAQGLSVMTRERAFLSKIVVCQRA
jgi:ubiquinone/menaquinone biosynthesis C-methylase UbiE